MTPCDGMSDECRLEATTTRDTSDGYLAPTPFCGPCAAAYDIWRANYEPPEPDGEAFRGGEAAAFQRDRQLEARRVK